MKIDKKLIKELVDHLNEFNLTELEYQDGQTKVKVSKAAKGIEQIKSSAVVAPNKAVLNETDEAGPGIVRKLNAQVCVQRVLSAFGKLHFRSSNRWHRQPKQRGEIPRKSEGGAARRWRQDGNVRPLPMV